MQYLTVQDIVWINSLAIKSAQRFDYLRLEEATYYQYGYGGSQDLAAQAASFLSGFRQKAPFEAGNEVTAFVAFAAFLLLNGKRVKQEAAKKLLGGATAETIGQSTEDAHSHGHAGVQEAVAQVFEEHADVVADLMSKTGRRATATTA